MCEAELQNVAFLLRREGDDGFLEVAETDLVLGASEVKAGNKEQAIFLVHQPGTYSCSYQTRTSDVPSVPSDTVTIEEYGECQIPALKISV